MMQENSDMIAMPELSEPLGSDLFFVLGRVI